jgi:hypothetical protein
MKNVGAIVCLLLGAAALGLLALWLGRIYYFSGSASETIAQLQMLGTEALVFGGTLATVTMVFFACGFTLLANTGRSRNNAEPN